FTMHGMRPRFGGRLGELLVKPIATHALLNVRTYVKHRDESGIFFIAEWLSNKLSVKLGPQTYGLPYRFGHLIYNHDIREPRGVVEAKGGRLAYRSRARPIHLMPCPPTSLVEFLLERYTAFTMRRGHPCLFRIWHLPWQQSSIELDVVQDDLITSA